jgi:hypothetical protein
VPTKRLSLTNNSQNVVIVYWSLEKDFGDSNPIWEERITLNPGESVYHEMNSAFGIKVYLEDSDGDGWISKYSHTVKKDQTVEVEFKRDFKPEP